MTSTIISPKRFLNEALDAHNKYRKLHGVPLLEHDANLSDLASEWAENLALNKKLEYKNEKYKGQILGENILKANTNYLSGDAITSLWYQEEKDYKYDGTFSKNTGHFTQVVWKETRKVGFGFASTDDGKFYSVFYYYPAGNYKNEFDKNVPRPLGDKRENKGIVEAIRPAVNKVVDSLSNKADKKAPEQIPDRNPHYNIGPEQSRFIYQALDAHNTCRRRHCVDPLLHNPELSKIAQDYANYLASIKKMTHSTNKLNGERLGENLAYSYDSRVDFYDGQKATMQWYDEIKDHDFNKDYQPGTGHFTQVVWKTTKEVGFGVAKASDGSFYAVGNYYPAGNLVGTFMKNVPRRVN